jgi:hypothetical protein
MTDTEQVDDGTPTDDSVDAAPPHDARFTQADLDRIVRDRLARQKAQFSDYEDLKARAEKLNELEQEQKSELEKANERAAQLEKQAQEASARAQEALLRSAVVAEAARKNVVDPDAALALLDRTALEFDSDGVPTNIGDAIDALLESKPYLAGKQRSPGPADLGARGSAGNQLTRDDLKNMTPEAILKAQNEGLLDNVMGRKP